MYTNVAGAVGAANSNVVPGGNKNPSRLKVVETFAWQRLLNDSVGPIQQRSVCQTKKTITMTLSYRRGHFR